jgi:hypothetical protein
MLPKTATDITRVRPFFENFIMFLSSVNNLNGCLEEMADWNIDLSFREVSADEISAIL